MGANDKISGVMENAFEEARKATDQYVQRLSAIEEETRAECKRIREEAEADAARVRAEADEYFASIQKKAQATVSMLSVFATEYRKLSNLASQAVPHKASHTAAPASGPAAGTAGQTASETPAPSPMPQAETTAASGDRSHPRNGWDNRSNGRSYPRNGRDNRSGDRSHARNDGGFCRTDVRHGGAVRVNRGSRDIHAIRGSLNRDGCGAGNAGCVRPGRRTRAGYDRRVNGYRRRKRSSAGAGRSIRTGNGSDGRGSRDADGSCI